jgi:hypothetical protein
MKKIKKLMSDMFRPVFILPKDNMREMKIYTFDEGTLIHEGLGISDERANELNEVISQATKNKNNKNQAMVLEQASNACNHPNELTMVVYSIAAVYEGRKNSPLDFLSEMIERRSKG